MKPIDIRELLRDKNPALSRWVPGWAVRGIERLICLPRINHVLQTYGSEAPLDFIRSTLHYIGVSYTLHGAEHIPSGGRAIFAANHPLGGLDGMALAAALARHVPQVRVVVNDLLMQLRPLRPIFAPVNKFGAQSADYARQTQAMYASRAAVITFPAGLCSRLIGGVVADLPWHANFVRKALESGRPVVPVYVAARNSRFFYRLARLRRWLGIGLNIEMLWLPREMFGQAQKQIHIYLGAPIRITADRSPAEWTQFVREAAYGLRPPGRKKK